ncbi:hypothetical protein O9K51_03970 [Purpureocillium lavendulum]|uniref:Secreted protein n=1 Tax=Purpureocillium lavendulum TaxID=1247861 RepID=A0AB34FU38_9HYPO|nr:hypothetical protein O9K51_03970 [Purpureocillium lavendulum]
MLKCGAFIVNVLRVSALFHFAGVVFCVVVRPGREARYCAEPSVEKGNNNDANSQRWKARVV